MATQAVITGVPLRRARVLSAAIFFMHGGLFASWTPHIPEIKARLDLSHATLGLALLGAPLGSVAAMIVTGALISRLGSGRIMIIGCLAYTLTAPLVGLAQSTLALFIALAIWGAGQGSLDVSMNSQAFAVERQYGRSIFASFHACWSIGAFTGTVIGSVAARMHVPLAVQFAVLGLVALAGVMPASRHILTAATEARSEKARIGRIPMPLLLLGLMAFANLIGEGAVADWSAVYLRETFDTGPGVAGAAYAAYTLSMFLGRLGSDRLVDRFGPVGAVRLHSATAAIGLSTALLTTSRPLALVGFGLFGVGLAGVVPAIFSAAGRTPGQPAGASVATVASFGWAGYVCGPPLIGTLANTFSLRAALGFVVVLTLVVFTMSRNLRR